MNDNINPNQIDLQNSTNNSPDNSVKEGKAIITNPTLMGWLTIFSIIIGLLGVYITFYFNKEAKPVYKILSNVTINEGFLSKVRVFYDSTEVQNVRAVTIAIWNAGNSYIDKEAFSKDKPITIQSSKPVSILDFVDVAHTRSDLNFVPTFVNDTVKGTPKDTTVNSYDYVNLKIKGDEGLESKDGYTFVILYTTNAINCDWQVTARIKGLPDGIVEAKIDLNQNDNNQQAISLNVTLSTFIFIFIAMSLRLNRKDIMGSIKFFPIINISVCLYFLYLVVKVWFDYFTSNRIPEILIGH